MKIVRISKESHIMTPWISFEEAALYLGITRHTLYRLEKEVLPLPAAGGTQRTRKFLTPVVDEWWARILELTNGEPEKKGDTCQTSSKP